MPSKLPARDKRVGGAGWRGERALRPGTELFDSKGAVLDGARDVYIVGEVRVLMRVMREYVC